MSQANYVPFDLLDDLHDGPPTEPRSLNDRLLMIVRTLPCVFSLHDVYRRAHDLERFYPRNTEMEAAIRAGLQTLRDAGLIEFLDNRGHYRRLPAAEPPRRRAA